MRSSPRSRPPRRAGRGAATTSDAIDRRRRAATSPRSTQAELVEALPDDLTPLITTFALGARTVARCVTRVRVEGDFDAIPREGPVILASNHISNADPVIIGAWLTPRLGRRIHWLGKKEMFDWPVVGWMARNGGVVPVDRGAADVEAFRLAQRVLDAGHVLVVFPEGTRSPTGELQVPKDGLAMLALRTNATIVPIGVSNTRPGLAEGLAPAAARRPRHDADRASRSGSRTSCRPGTDRKAREGRRDGRDHAAGSPALARRRHRGPYGDAASA